MILLIRSLHPCPSCIIRQMIILYLRCISSYLPQFFPANKDSRFDAACPDSSSRNLPNDSELNSPIFVSIQMSLSSYQSLECGSLALFVYRTRCLATKNSSLQKLALTVSNSWVFDMLSFLQGRCKRWNGWDPWYSHQTLLKDHIHSLL